MRLLLLAAVAAYDPENQATYLPATYDAKADDLAAHARHLFDRAARAASRASEGYGPVVTSAAHPAYLGARRHTNNTAELTALAELLRALLSSSPQRAGSRGVVRTDSEYAAACMMGRVTPKTNRQLAERLRSLWRRLRAKHTVTWRHVEGHSGNKWNDYVDELAARGRRGDRGSNAAEWADATIPTDTPDEGSNAEGDDSSTSGHGATGGGQDSEREDDSDADCGPATPTATASAELKFLTQSPVVVVVVVVV